MYNLPITSILRHTLGIVVSIYILIASCSYAGTLDLESYSQCLSDLELYEGWGPYNNDCIYEDYLPHSNKYILTLPGGVHLTPHAIKFLRCKLKYAGNLNKGAKVPRHISESMQQWYVNEVCNTKKLEGFKNLHLDIQNHLLQLGYTTNFLTWKDLRKAVKTGNIFSIPNILRDSKVWRDEQEAFKRNPLKIRRWENTILRIEDFLNNLRCK